MGHNSFLYITAASFVGGRDENQDCYLIDDIFHLESPGNISLVVGEKLPIRKRQCFAVSDGMGGMENGKETSLRVIRNLHRFRKVLDCNEDIWYKINKNVLKSIRRSNAASGATASVCLLLRKKKQLIAKLFSIGDSPIFLFSDQTHEVTLINTLDNEARLSTKELTEEEKKKKSRYLHHYFGRDYGKDNPPMHEYSFEVTPGDVIILASDGLCSINEEQIQTIVMSPKYTSLALSLTSAAIEAADARCDNTTAVVIEIME